MKNVLLVLKTVVDRFVVATGEPFQRFQENLFGLGEFECYEYAHLLKPMLLSKIKSVFVRVTLRELATYSPKNHKIVVFTVN